MNKGVFSCRVCGLNQNEYPWGEDNNSPSFGICSCCGTEFGYHDCNLKSTRIQREKWLRTGGKWHEEAEKPAMWSLEDQMKNIPKNFL